MQTKSKSISQLQKGGAGGKFNQFLTMTNTNNTERENNLQLSKARYYCTLEESLSTIHLASFPGFLALGNLSRNCDEFNLKETVILYQNSLIPFIKEVVFAYNHLKAKSQEPRFTVISTSTYQRIVASLDRYKNNFIFQVRIQFVPEDAKDNEAIEVSDQDTDSKKWHFTRKGVVLSLGKIHQMMEQLDSLLISS